MNKLFTKEKIIYFIVSCFVVGLTLTILIKLPTIVFINILGINWIRYLFQFIFSIICISVIGMFFARDPLSAFRLLFLGTISVYTLMLFNFIFGYFELHSPDWIIPFYASFIGGLDVLVYPGLPSNHISSMNPSGSSNGNSDIFGASGIPGKYDAYTDQELLDTMVNAKGTAVQATNEEDARKANEIFLRLRHVYSLRVSRRGATSHAILTYVQEKLAEKHIYWDKSSEFSKIKEPVPSLTSSANYANTKRRCASLIEQLMLEELNKRTVESTNPQHVNKDILFKDLSAIKSLFKYKQGSSEITDLLLACKKNNPEFFNKTFTRTKVSTLIENLRK